MNKFTLVTKNNNFGYAYLQLFFRSTLKVILILLNIVNIAFTEVQFEFKFASFKERRERLKKLAKKLAGKIRDFFRRDKKNEKKPPEEDPSETTDLKEKEGKDGTAAPAAGDKKNNKKKN